jgi:hypothetical protein
MSYNGATFAVGIRLQWATSLGNIMPVKFSSYFLAMRSRSDRAIIREEWIVRAVEHPVREVIQQDGRIRRWAQIDEMDGKYLRVILLPDQETVHNAFFDRTFRP